MEKHEFSRGIVYCQKFWPKWNPSDEAVRVLSKRARLCTYEAFCHAVEHIYATKNSIASTAPIADILNDAIPKTENHADNKPGMNPQEFAQYCQRIRDEDAEQDAILLPFDEGQLRTMVIEAAKMEFVNKHGQTIRPFGWLAKVLLDAKRIGSLAKPSGKCNQDERLARDAAEWFCRGAHAKELPDLEAYRLELAIKAQNTKRDVPAKMA